MKTNESNETKTTSKKLKKQKGFFSFTKKYYKLFMPFFIAMIVLVFLSTFFKVVQPKILNQLLISISKGQEWWIWIALMFLFLIFIGIITYISGIIGGKLGKKIEIEARKDTLNNLIKQDMSYFSDKKSGEMLTKVISDTSIVGNQAQMIPSKILSSIFTIFGESIILCWIDWRLFLVTIFCTMIVIFIVLISFSTLRKRMLEARKVVMEVNGKVSEKISTVSLIKSSGTEEKERNFFEKIHHKYYESNNKANNSISLMMTVMTVGITSISTIVIMSATLIYHNKIDKLFLILPSFLSGVMILVSPIIQMAQLSQGMAQGSTSATRLDELINSKTRIDILDDENKIHLENLDGDIVFKDVVFSYPEKPDSIILPKTTFTFEAGKSYAFVGETGVGKSTISKLLLRYYDPLKGNIFINGNINLKDVYVPSYLSKVGYVEQEPQVLSGTIIENVSYGLDNITKEDVVDACKKAKLDKIINSWTNKYETVIGERGITLSGGQKQRLVIARMFLKNPSLLIFDEATSSLDNIVESEINKELQILSKGKTTITIAHRLSTIQNVDKIIVLKKDKGIVQTGTFKELKSKKGYFKELYDAGLMK